MDNRQLGRSGLLVSELCLGTMIFGEDSPRSATPDIARQMIDRFLEAGGNFIDTSNVYAAGQSEKIIGRAGDPARPGPRPWLRRRRPNYGGRRSGHKNAVLFPG